MGIDSRLCPVKVLIPLVSSKHLYRVIANNQLVPTGDYHQPHRIHPTSPRAHKPALTVLPTQSTPQPKELGSRA